MTDNNDEFDPSLLLSILGNDNKKSEYKPTKSTIKVLDRALELVNSVPYQVSARWLFYRLYQEGIYKSKKDYQNKFLNAIRAARHAEVRGWKPDTLADDTRAEINRDGMFNNVETWLKAIGKAKCSLEKWHEQPVYIEIWYEARAMTAQFEYYTKYITLRPMAGQPSIPFKYQTAKDIENIYDYYQKPVVILYFGDLDPAGETISEVIERDVKNWCDVDFHFIRSGLTPEQVMNYNIPESVDHPGAYQWEAVDDPTARKIINEALKPFELRQDVFSKVEAEQTKAEAWLKDKLVDLVSDWGQS